MLATTYLGPSFILFYPAGPSFILFSSVCFGPAPQPLLSPPRPSQAANQTPLLPLW